MRLALLAIAVATGLSAQASATPVLRVGGEPALATKAAAREVFRAADFQALPAADLRFQTLDGRRIEAMQRSNAADGKRLQIGIGRNSRDELDSGTVNAALAWRAVSGGHVARVDVRSPDAKAMRVGLDVSTLPDAAELRVAGSAQPSAVFAETAGIAKQRLDGESLFWTAVTDGDTQWLEVFVPTGTARPSTLPVPGISHLLVAPNSSRDFTKALGGSGSCNVDVVCRRNALGAAYDAVENAVAHMVFSSGGSSFVCTGTLLNDNTPSTQVPYFYSAAHCLSTQSVANTLQTFWEYESPTCGVVSNGTRTQLGGGATLLFANTTSDVLFLRLNSAPPAGSYYAGWDASTLSAGTATLAIHHPAGDNKKSSLGSHSGFSTLNGGGSYARSSWSSGTTEGGSSGSGLFVRSNDQYYLRGGLQGGAAACSNMGLSEGQGNVDYYSRFDQAYPSLQQWLGTQASIGPTRVYDGPWYQPSESGWGLAVFQYPGQLFILMFHYDSAGRPNWYRMQGPWTDTDTATNVPLDKAALNGGWGGSFNPNNVSYTRVGSANIQFTGRTTATLSFTAEGVTRTVTINKLE